MEQIWRARGESQALAWIRVASSRPRQTEGTLMAAMKPRTGDGPLEVTKEGRGIVLRMPLEGGGRLVVEMTPDEVRALGDAITDCEGLK
jgi:hypothetical protein